MPHDKLTPKEYFDEFIPKIDFNLLREFLHKQLYNECLTQITYDIQKLDHNINKLYQLKTLIKEQQNENC